MNQPNYRRAMKREIWIALLGAFCVLTAVTVGTEAQEPVVKPKLEAGAELTRRSSLVEGAYGLTRPGNPDDTVAPGGAIIPAVSFAAEGLKKFKIMGATVYFAVFKNTGDVDGDTFGTGMANFDHRFREGTSFQNSFSPKYDRRAKYLYLYQVVNDRGLERPEVQGKINPVKPAIGGVKSDGSVIPTEDIGSFALKLLVDPLYITSWGHFNDSGFASNVVELTTGGQVVKQVVAGKETEKENVIRLAVSYHPSIQARISRPEYSKRARALDLNELAPGFGVDVVNSRLKDTKVHQQLNETATQLEKKGIVLTATAPTVETRLKAATTAYQPDFVQLIPMTNEERAQVTTVPAAAGNVNLAQDEITRAIFRVDWRKGNTMKQGGHSVVFGFTTDLPPVAAPIRIDTPRAAQFSEGLRLASFFADTGAERAVGAGTGTGVIPAAVGAEGAAAAIAMGSSLGQAVTPVPAPAEVGDPGAGFAGVTGGVNSFGGVAPSGGIGGGLAVPALGGIGGVRGTTGGGGGITGGGGGQTDTGTTGQGQNQNSNVPSINFNATLTNQQQQQQNQNQSQHNHGGHGHHHGGGHGHVVPAPASLLLGLLGLPGLFLLRRRKPDATV